VEWFPVRSEIVLAIGDYEVARNDDQRRRQGESKIQHSACRWANAVASYGEMLWYIGAGPRRYGRSFSCTWFGYTARVPRSRAILSVITSAGLGFISYDLLVIQVSGPLCTLILRFFLRYPRTRRFSVMRILAGYHYDFIIAKNIIRYTLLAWKSIERGRRESSAATHDCRDSTLMFYVSLW
jgi:hypothetical protein